MFGAFSSLPKEAIVINVDAEGLWIDNLLPMYKSLEEIGTFAFGRRQVWRTDTLYWDHTAKGELEQ